MAVFLLFSKALQCFFELLSHEYGTEAIKGWEVGVWTPLKATPSPCQVSWQWNGSSHSFFSFKYYDDTIQAVLPWNILLCCSAFALQIQTEPPKGCLPSKASPGEISLFTKQQHCRWAAQSLLCRLPVQSPPLSPCPFWSFHLTVSSYWNKPVICRNYCSDPRRNHKVQPWNPGCSQINTNNRVHFTSAGICQTVITVYVYHSVPLGTSRIGCVT